MTRRVLIIVNPAAGRTRSRRRHLARVLAALERRGCAVTVRAANGAPGTAETLARTAEPEFDVIVAAGGDGTIAAVVNGLVAPMRPVAILPFGTANVLAAELGVPGDAEACAAMIAGGSTRHIWPGTIEGKLFVTSAGAGFDAEVVAAVDPGCKRRYGKLAFAWAALACLWRYREPELAVTVDGTEHRVSAAIVTTGPLYAGRFPIAPDARLCDPGLHVVLVPGRGRRAVLRYGAALLGRRLPGAAGMTILPAQTVHIVGGPGNPVQADGDIAGYLPVTLGVAPRSIPFLHAVPVRRR